MIECLSLYKRIPILKMDEKCQLQMSIQIQGKYTGSDCTFGMVNVTNSYFRYIAKNLEYLSCLLDKHAY